MMRITAITLLIFSLVFSTLAEAKTVPQKRKEDGRIREVYYSETQVVEIPTSYGFATTIEFGDETIKTVVSGDTVGWQVVPQGDRLFINPGDKSQAKGKDTNITVITDKRSYYLHVFIASNKDPVFVIRYRYDFREPPEKNTVPQELKPIKVKKTKETQQNIEKQKQSTELKQPKKGMESIAGTSKNYDYQMTGSEAIVIKQVFDDGRFTYFKFGSDKKTAETIIYLVNDRGYEEPIKMRQEGKYLVVEKIGARFTVREGALYKCIKSTWNTVRSN